MWLDLFQDRDTRDITILPRVVTECREGRFGDAVTMDEKAFRERGSVVIRDVLASARTNPPAYEDWTTDNRLLWDMHLKKPRTLALQLRPDLDVATVRILHYDNAEIAAPCDLGEEMVTSLTADPDAFAGMLLGAFTRSKDFVWLGFDLVDVAAFFCLYNHEGTGVIYWFDWVRVDLPAPHSDAVTAWNRHRIFDPEELRPQFRDLTIQCLHEFSLRRTDANPVLNPRGSQVADAGVGDWRRVVVYRRNDENKIFFRSYDYDTTARKQEVSGHEICINAADPPGRFFDAYIESMNNCSRE